MSHGGVEAFISVIRKKPTAVTPAMAMGIHFTRPVREAIITSGGVKVGEVQPATMESKLVRGLFFAGEILDTDAYTGGFNLQIAWATGHCAGCAAAEYKEMQQ